MAGSPIDDQRGHAMRRALALTIEALDVLDAHDGPAEAKALLELAREKLRETLQSLPGGAAG